jgi:predicted metal-binding membrane protein
MTPLRAARTQPQVIGALLVAAALAWWSTAQRMGGMDAGPGADLGTLDWFAGAWAVMMAAMMLPSLGPTLASYLTPSGGRGLSRSLLFTGGYLLVWSVAGVFCYGVYESGRSLFGSDLSWDAGGRWLAGGVVAVAAAYQFTPLKRACQLHCRGELVEGRGKGPNALAMGLRGGGWCIGCSGALMAALFALGVMSLVWMSLIAALVALEKTAPGARATRLATAVVLVALAVGVVVAPDLVPGLVVPGPNAMHAM